MTNSPIPDHLIDGGHAHASESALHAEDKGYHKNLKPRQIQMIAIGGAIGTGLFLGPAALRRPPARPWSSPTPSAG